MIQDVIGVKEFQSTLPSIVAKIAKFGGHYLVSKRNKPVMVTMPFADYQQIEDILLELNSPILMAEIEEGRKNYKIGKTKNLRDVLNEISD